MLSFDLEIDFFDEFPELVAHITYSVEKDFDFVPYGEEFVKNYSVQISIESITFSQFGCGVELPSMVDRKAERMCLEAAEEHYDSKGCAA